MQIAKQKSLIMHHNAIRKKKERKKERKLGVCLFLFIGGLFEFWGYGPLLMHNALNAHNAHNSW